MELRKVIEDFHPQCEQEIQDRRMMLRYMELFDDLLFRTNEIAHFSASAWIVDPSRTRALMAYHNIYHSWAWTGGHADGDGDLLCVAMREAREETSLRELRPLMAQPLSLEILTVGAHFKHGKYVVPHLHLNVTYLFEADDRQFIQSKPDENSAVRWFSLDEAVAASSEAEMQLIYQKLNERAKRLF